MFFARFEWTEMKISVTPNEIIASSSTLALTFARTTGSWPQNGLIWISVASDNPTALGTVSACVYLCAGVSARRKWTWLGFLPCASWIGRPIVQGLKPQLAFFTITFLEILGMSCKFLRVCPVLFYAFHLGQHQANGRWWRRLVVVLSLQFSPLCPGWSL